MISYLNSLWDSNFLDKAWYILINKYSSIYVNMILNKLVSYYRKYAFYFLLKIFISLLKFASVTIYRQIKTRWFLNFLLGLHLV